jgi:PDZ domain
MGQPLRVILLLALAVAARAEPPCEEARRETGLALARRAEGLVVAEVDADSPASAGGLRPGDVVLQTNERLATTCGEYARAVRDARRGRKVLLVLVRRGDEQVPLALRPVASAPAIAGVAPDERIPAVPPAPPPPEPLPPEVPLTLVDVMRGLDALPPERMPRRLAGYREDLERLDRQVETLAVRGTATPDVVSGLRGTLRPYQAAAVAWEAADAAAERDHRSRRLPVNEMAGAPYFDDSPAATVIAEFPALSVTVARQPRPGVIGESSGLWRPWQARALLWERGRVEREALRGRLGALP